MKALVADDDATTCALLCAVLSELGHDADVPVAGGNIRERVGDKISGGIGGEERAAHVAECGVSQRRLRSARVNDGYAPS